MTLAEIVADYVARLPAGVVLSQEDVERLLLKAVRFYAGFAVIKSVPPADGEYSSAIPAGFNNSGVDLTPGEYAVISPLWLLYVEYENATNLEASRGMGVDVYGRSSSEVANDIAQTELDMPHRVFIELPETI
jgi:hypothetical protein